MLRSCPNLPWLTKTVTQAIRRCNFLFRAAKHSKSLSSYQRYHATRNCVTALDLLNVNKSNYFKNKGSKEFWMAIKLLNKQTSSIPTLISNGSPKWKAAKRRLYTLLNCFFHDSFNKALPPLTPHLPLCVLAAVLPTFSAAMRRYLFL